MSLEQSELFGKPEQLAWKSAQIRGKYGVGPSYPVESTLFTFI